ncbi:hypothetical protein RSAG8_09066, partial [Rhizoctonia solani AG-8 WAC10335]
MFRLAYGLIALLASPPLVAAARLPDGNYRTSYSAECGVGTQHYFDLTSATAEATFNPIPASKIQTVGVTSPLSCDNSDIRTTLIVQR